MSFLTGPHYKFRGVDKCMKQTSVSVVSFVSSSLG
jgi:hypothetical protein